MLSITPVAGCAKVTVNGHTLRADVWERDERAIRERASFDLSCPAEQLELRVLDVSGNFARQVGVTGCGQQAVYVDPQQTSMWVMNSAAE